MKKIDIAIIKFDRDKQIKAGLKIVPVGIPIKAIANIDYLGKILKHCLKQLTHLQDK